MEVPLHGLHGPFWCGRANYCGRGVGRAIVGLVGCQALPHVEATGLLAGRAKSLGGWLGYPWGLCGCCQVVMNRAVSLHGWLVRVMSR